MALRRGTGGSIYRFHPGGVPGEVVWSLLRCTYAMLCAPFFGEASLDVEGGSIEGDGEIRGERKASGDFVISMGTLDGWTESLEMERRKGR